MDYFGAFSGVVWGLDASKQPPNKSKASLEMVWRSFKARPQTVLNSFGSASKQLQALTIWGLLLLGLLGALEAISGMLLGGAAACARHQLV